MPSPGFAAIGIYHSDDRLTLLSSGGRVIVFDTPAVARHFLPALRPGAIDYWSADVETVWFSPIAPGYINRAAIITNYDPYNLPPGLPVCSEVHAQEWRRHVYWNDVLRGLIDEQGMNSLSISGDAYGIMG